MSFLLLLASGLADLAATLGKWLFVVTAPVLLIVVGSYFQAGKSCLEPIAGLALVSSIFAATHWLSLKVEGLRAQGLETDSEILEATAGPVLNEAARCNWYIEVEDRKRMMANKASRLATQRQAELWRQANPWGGYNPHE